MMESTKPSSYRVVVLVSGRGSNLEALVKKSREQDAGFAVVGVVSDRESALGLMFARNEGIEAMVVPRLPNSRSEKEFNLALAQCVAGLKPDIVVLAGFMRVLQAEFISAFPGKVINIHPALLPSFRGLHGQAQALQAGVKFAGCTVHFVVEEVDAGAIIAQSVVRVLPEDTEETLSARILKQEHILLPAVVKAFAQNAIHTVWQAGRLKVMIRPEFEATETSLALSSLKSAV